MSQLTVQTTVDISASAQDAWRLFGEGFGEWADWAPGIDSSELQGELKQGVIRVNKAESLGTVTQELVRYEPEGRALAYEMREGLPPFFHSVRNDWEIKEIEPGKIRLEGTALFDLKDDAEKMKEQLQGKMGMVLEVFANAFRDKLQAS